MKEQKTPRLLIILPSLRAGGTERIRLFLAEGLLDHLFSVDILTFFAGGQLEADLSKDINYHCLDVRRIRYGIYALYKHLCTNKYDSVLIGLWPLTVICPLIVRLSGINSRVRIVASEHASLVSEYAGIKLYFLLAQSILAIGLLIASPVCLRASQPRYEA